MAGVSALRAAVAPGGFLDSDVDLALYSYDAALDRGRPEAVVLPACAEEARRVVELCARHGIPFVARGAGTNLSGGCVPLRGGAVVALARLNRIVGIDAEARAAVVEPGVVNQSLQRALEPRGLFYAPDPASLRVSTLGGNIAENAGGPRCVKYGVTTHHVLALECVMPDGSLEKFSLDDEGPEVMSLLVGAEGTLGVVTRAWLRLTPEPAAIHTLLAAFPSIGAAVECVAAIVACGIIPRVLEAMDRVTIDSVEAYAHAGYPRSEAVLLIEVDGGAREAAEEARQVEELCRRCGATEARAARDAAERERLWEGRRGAYAAMARLAPNVMVEDGVVPRDQLPEVVRRIREICDRRKLTVGLLFHAGDGNIHPNIGFDERDLEQTARVRQASREILQACVDLGGSLSGEHGIGLDKREAMAWLLAPEALELFRAVKRALDPGGLANPDKLIPLAGQDGRAEGLARRRPAPALSEAQDYLSDKARQCFSQRRAMSVLGTGSRGGREADGCETLRTAALRQIIDWDRRNLTLTVEAGLSPRELAETLGKEGFHLRLPACAGTLGGLFASKAWPRLREDLLGMRLLLADGRVVALGGKVVKNVAGYEVPRLMIGSWGAYAVILELTLRLYRRRQDVAPAVRDAARPFAPNRWHRALKAAFDPSNLLNPWHFG